MTKLRIATTPRNCVETLSDGTCPDGASVSVAGVSRYTIDSGDVILAVAVLAASVPVNLFRVWLYEKLKQEKCEKVYINHRDVPLETQEIQRAVEEEIQRQEHRDEDDNTEDGNCGTDS